MKSCPKCGQSYSEDINFCLNDGELLSRLGHSIPSAIDDSPPTVVLDQARVTNPTGWNPPAGLPVQYQQQYQSPIFNPAMATASQDQVLAIVSVATGAASLTIGWCCSLGLLLGPAAIITGIIALIQNKNDPARYGGRGLAIAGIITGSLFIVFWLIYIVFVVLLNLINI